jgi:hypothetical protein
MGIVTIYCALRRLVRLSRRFGFTVKIQHLAVGFRKIGLWICRV